MRCNSKWDSIGNKSNDTLVNSGVSFDYIWNKRGFLVTTSHFAIKPTEVSFTVDKITKIFVSLWKGGFCFYYLHINI